MQAFAQQSEPAGLSAYAAKRVIACNKMIPAIRPLRTVKDLLQSHKARQLAIKVLVITFPPRMDYLPRARPPEP